MRASEAAAKFCPFSFGLRDIPHLVEGGPCACLTDRCMAWSVYRAAGSKSNQSDMRPVPAGFEIDPDALKRVGNIGIRATEDHGECHALPARPE